MQTFNFRYLVIGICVGLIVCWATYFTTSYFKSKSTVSALEKENNNLIRLVDQQQSTITATETGLKRIGERVSRIEEANQTAGNDINAAIRIIDEIGQIIGEIEQILNDLES